MSDKAQILPAIPGGTVAKGKGFSDLRTVSGFLHENRVGRLLMCVRCVAATLVLTISVAVLAGCASGPRPAPGQAFAPGWTPASNAPPIPARKPPPPNWVAATTEPERRAEVVAVPLRKPAPGNPAISPVLRPVAPTATQPAVARSAEAPVRPVRAQAPVSYRVQPGDSLFGLSRRFGTPIQAIIRANGMAPPYGLIVGQSLTIPQPLVHRVQPGDTIYGVSRRYGVDLTELVRANEIQPPFRLVPGQQLIMPEAPGQGGDGRPGEIATAERTPAPAPITTAAAPQVAESVAGAAQTANVGTSEPPAPVVSQAGSQPRTTQQAALPPSAIPQPPKRSSERFLKPVNGPLLARFGAGSDGVHNDGINIAAPRGTPVKAAENGVVAYAGEELRGFGKLLLIKHADGWVTAYAHNEALLVQRGEKVRRGQAIARVGSSGNVSRPQLHFEVRRGTRAVNPETVLAGG